MALLRLALSPNFGGPLLSPAPLWFMVHTAEGATTDDSLAGYIAQVRSGVSYHYLVDDDSETQCVYETQQSWSALGANRKAIHDCTTGFARWSRAEWLNHPVMLEKLAARIADVCTRQGITIRRLTDDQIRAGLDGVLGHGDYSRATGDGDHSDPGIDFPWDVVIVRALVIANPQLTTSTPSEEDQIMAVLDDIKSEIANRSGAYPLQAYQEGGGIILRAAGVKWIVPDPAYFDLVVFLRLCGPAVVGVGSRENISGFLDTMFNLVLDQGTNGTELTAALDKLAASITADQAKAIVAATP